MWLNGNALFSLLLGCLQGSDNSALPITLQLLWTPPCKTDDRLHPVCFVHHPWFVPSVLVQVPRNGAFQWLSSEAFDLVQVEWLGPFFGQWCMLTAPYFVVYLHVSRTWIGHGFKMHPSREWLVCIMSHLILMQSILSLSKCSSTGRWCAGRRWWQPPKSTSLWGWW